MISEGALSKLIGSNWKIKSKKIHFLWPYRYRRADEISRKRNWRQNPVPASSKRKNFVQKTFVKRRQAQWQSHFQVDRLPRSFDIPETGPLLLAENVCCIYVAEDRSVYEIRRQKNPHFHAEIMAIEDVTPLYYLRFCYMRELTDFLDKSFYGLSSPYCQSYYEISQVKNDVFNSIIYRENLSTQKKQDSSRP